MAEVTFSAEELASLVESRPTPAEFEWPLTGPFGDEPSAPTPAGSQPYVEVTASAVPEDPLRTVLTPSASAAPVQYAWENAYHLLPQQLLPLVKRYPAIGIMRHAKHGLVVLATYLEDKQKRIRRNLQIGNDTFQYASEIEIIEPDTRAFDCRIVIKMFRYQPGMRIRYWENTPNGDTPERSGAFELTEHGLRRINRAKARW